MGVHDSAEVMEREIRFSKNGKKNYNLSDMTGMGSEKGFYYVECTHDIKFFQLPDWKYWFVLYCILYCALYCCLYYLAGHMLQFCLNFHSWDN